ncbi:hypothetical protein [Nisaea sp.]|uniref:hypothetical protein n=1 Tax=Nisaea sp. TaxID=2024842 RepID=UPI0032656C44
MDEVFRIALIGKSGSGKSAVAEILSQKFDVPIIKTGAVCRKVSKILFGNEDKRSTQMLDDALTQIDGSIFLKSALRGVTDMDGYIIDSIRFSSDLSLAKYNGCKILRILAQDSIRVQRLQERGQVFSLESDGNHRSEVELDGVSVDNEIVNENSIAHLKCSIVSMYYR